MAAISSVGKDSSVFTIFFFGIKAADPVLNELAPPVDYAAFEAVEVVEVTALSLPKFIFVIALVMV